jgi:uncharacterized membrane protein
LGCPLWLSVFGPAKIFTRVKAHSGYFTMLKFYQKPAILVRILLALMIIGYALFFSIQLILHYNSFGSRALDLGNMGQAIWNTSQGRWFHQTNQPGAVNRLSLHVEPILIPVSTLYWLFPGPEILFIFQSVIVALGAIPVFALGRHALRRDWLALVFAFSFLMMPAVQAATLLDFHAVTLAPTFLIAAFYFMEIRRPVNFTIFAVLAVACKEDITLLVMMMGVYALLINRQRRWGLITITLTGVWAFLAVFVIPPAFAGTENIHWDRYGHLGSSPINILLNLILQPQLVVDHLKAVDAVGYFRLLLAPTAYTALFSPATLLLALPSFGINLLSSFPPMQRVNSLIYAAPVIPAVIISSIYGVKNLVALINRSGEELSWLTAYSAPVLGLLVLTATLVYHVTFGYLPGGGQYRGWEEVTHHHRLAAEIFAEIPQQARLSAQDRLNPHVSKRESLYIFDRVDDADHIVLDVTQDSWPLHPIEQKQRIEQFLNEGFGVVTAKDGYILLAKDQPDLPTQLPDEFYSFARAPASVESAQSTRVVFDDSLELIGYRLHLGAHEKFLPVITFYWRALRPLSDDYILWPYFSNRNGQLIVTPTERPLVTPLWYPTSQWRVGEIIQVSTLPFDLAPNPGDAFTLAVGVAKNDWNDAAQRLRITSISPELYLLEGDSVARLATYERTGRKQYTLIDQEGGSPEQPRNDEFWDLITLTGVDLPAKSTAPGTTVPFSLYWQSKAPITVDLTTFAHIRDRDGNLIAQLDWIPQDAWGLLPTSAWMPGRQVVDRQSVQLPNDIQSGTYSLVVGWYYAPSGERLPVTRSTSGKKSENVVEVGQITVTN